VDIWLKLNSINMPSSTLSIKGLFAIYSYERLSLSECLVNERYRSGMIALYSLPQFKNMPTQSSTG